VQETTNDFVDGGPGTDQLYGDAFYIATGEQGSDTINARDGETDEVYCGLGFDTVTADTIDKWSAECEQVSTGNSPGGTAATTVSQAKKMLPRFLQHTYHGEFTKRRHFGRSCKRRDATHVRCSVHWIHGTTYYWGKVTMWLRPDNPNLVAARITIHHRHSRLRFLTSTASSPAGGILLAGG
jgi:hypothetical protein